MNFVCRLYRYRYRRHYVFELTTSSNELNTKKFFDNLALHSVKSSGKTRHSFRYREHEQAI
jgi:hypothetical protein